MHQNKWSKETHVLTLHNWIHSHPTIYPFYLLLSSFSIVLEASESKSMVWGGTFSSSISRHSFLYSTAPLSLLFSFYFIIFDSSASISIVWRKTSSSSPPQYYFHPTLYISPCSSLPILFHLNLWHQPHWYGVKLPLLYHQCIIFISIWNISYNCPNLQLCHQPTLPVGLE